jgi:hypothetical protein
VAIVDGERRLPSVEWYAEICRVAEGLAGIGLTRAIASVIARFFGTLLLGREHPSSAAIGAVIGPGRILRYVCCHDGRYGVTSRSH